MSISSRRPFVQFVNRAVSGFVVSPVLLRFGSFIIVKFGVITGLVLACGVSVLILASYILRFSDVHRFYVEFAVPLPLAIVIGSIIFQWILRAPEIRRSPHEIGAATFCFYGGLAGSILTAFFVARRIGISPIVVADFTFVIVPFFHGISRLACLNYGCCYGREKLREGLCVAYWNPLAKANRAGHVPGVTRHPVQLYEMGLCIALSLVLAMNYGLNPYRGSTVTLYFVGYGLMRMFLEDVRQPAPDFCKGLPVWKWISIAVAVAGAATIVFWRYAPLQIAIMPISGDVLEIACHRAVWSFLVLAISYSVHYRQIGRWF